MTHFVRQTTEALIEDLDRQPRPLILYFNERDGVCDVQFTVKLDVSDELERDLYELCKRLGFVCLDTEESNVAYVTNVSCIDFYNRFPLVKNDTPFANINALAVWRNLFLRRCFDGVQGYFTYSAFTTIV